MTVTAFSSNVGADETANVGRCSKGNDGWKCSKYCFTHISSPAVWVLWVGFSLSDLSIQQTRLLVAERGRGQPKQIEPR